MDAITNRLKATPLDTWIRKAEGIGQIKRITAEVDPDLETSTINYLAGKDLACPALMFENIKGHKGYRALYNMLGSSLTRFSLALDVDPIEHPLDAVRLIKDRMRKTIPPTAIAPEAALVNDVVLTGGDVDLTRFPAPRMWPLDGGRYIGTADAVITKDPETGRINAGCYRQMVKGRNEVSLYASPGKDVALDMQKWWKQGKPAPVAIAYGIDPLLFMVAGQSFPKTESEYGYYGGLKGAPFEVFEGDVTGLPIPAHVEILAEGFASPGETTTEGPFGEFTGYYGRSEGPCPSIKFKKLRHRKDPILTCSFMAEYPSGDCTLPYAIMRAGRVWNDLDSLGVPGIQGVWTPMEASVFGMTVVSIKQMYAGHSAQVLGLAAQCMAGAYFTKYIIVVDDDIDPTNMSEVIWAVATRSRPAHSIDFLRDTWSTYLDPSQNPPENRPYGSKALINACMEHRYLKSFSPRSRISKTAYEQVAARWNELGFSGKAPRVSAFEEAPFPPTLPMPGK